MTGRCLRRGVDREGIGLLGLAVGLLERRLRNWA
jgi:hypothetical protein